MRTILEHAEDYPWRMQDIGLLGLRLDDRREHRLHVWGPTYSVGEPPVHDHPYDFTSTVVVGEMTNTRYVEDPVGHRVPPRALHAARRERAHDRHRDASPRPRPSCAPATSTRNSRTNCTTVASSPGTVTIIRMSFVDVPALTVCTPSDAPWVSARSRPPTPDELEAITGAALDLFA